MNDVKLEMGDTTLNISTEGNNTINFIYDIEQDKLSVDYIFPELVPNFAERVIAHENDNPDFISRFEHELHKAITRQGSMRFSCEYLGKYESMRYYSVIGRYNGKTQTMDGVIIDSTNDKVTMHKLQHADKLRSLGSLVGCIAHDFNNQLMVILGNVQLAIKNTTDQRIQKYLSNILSASTNSSELIEKILHFGHLGSETEEEVDIVKCLNDMIIVLEHTTLTQSRMIYDCMPNELIVKGEFGDIQNAFMNVAKNALESLTNDGVLLIRVSSAFLDELPKNTVVCEEFKSQAYACVEIIDNGTGIEPDILEKIFTPFFSTKGFHNGTGLGLSNVMNTVKQYHGVLTLDTRVGIGSNFTFYYPLIREVNQMSLPIEEELKIMVIDDEELVTMIVCDIIQDIGYETISFSKGKDAVEYYACHQEEILLVICDMMLPGMDGLEILRRLKSINNELKFIFLSGYSKEHLNMNSRCDVDAYLTKPLQIEEFDRVIGEVLKKDKK